MGVFRWLSAGEIPPACDLRRCGWHLAERGAAFPGSLALVHFASVEAASWIDLLDPPGQETRGRILLVGIRDAADRARLLHLGFGEVLGERPELAELEARAMRVVRQADLLPRHRDHGCLRLDLLARDGFVAGRPLGLHPREFELIWRLGDTPGVPASKQALVSDVWRLCHVPETNSLAVHVFRLRAKLALAGLDGLVETAPAGGYVLAPPSGPGPVAIPLTTRDSPLDSYTRLREDAAAAARDKRHDA